MVFPMFVKSFIDKKGYFESFRSISYSICDMVDSELERSGYCPFFAGSFEFEYGYACDLRIESGDARFGQEVNLHAKNYEDMFFSTYLDLKVLNLNVHVKENILHAKTQLASSLDNAHDRAHVSYNTPVRPVSNVKSEDRNKLNDVSNVAMFRGHPIDISGPKVELKMEEHSTPVLKNVVHRDSTPRTNVKNAASKTLSPLSVYDDEDYIVKDHSRVIPFGQQSIQHRVMDLQTAATVTVPDVSTLPKLLKSHNVGYKDGDNAATWYLRFNNFCLMLGIYLPPPHAMQKDSEMGKEWDSQALPFVFYSRFSHMEKVLSHILFAPDFFPKSMMDELQLNPKPYNFLHLFMALYSHSVPDLSDRIIKRPGPMKHGQSLAQYALSWVHYFADEANVNGLNTLNSVSTVTLLMGLPRVFLLSRNFWRWSSPRPMTVATTFLSLWNSAIYLLR